MKHLKFFIFLCILTFTVSCGQQKRFIQYKVKQGDTMSKIAQKLKMKTDKLIRLNPDVVGEPRPNSFLVVPEKNLEAYKKNTPIVIEEKDSISSNDLILDDRAILLENLKERYEFYEVKKGDTFYNIEKRFDVNRQELLILNPDLKEGLKLGMILKIRELKVKELIDEDFYSDYIEPNSELKVALLLPFKAYEYQVDTLTLKEIFAQNSTLLNITTDFYLGAEIAIDSLRNKGISINFNVFDTGSRNSGTLPKIIAENNLNDFDAIIGPLYSSEVQTVASNVAKPVIFPVYSKNQSSFNYSNIFKTSPDKNVFREELENHIKENFVDGNIIIVSDNSFQSLQTANLIQSNLTFGTNGLVNVIKPENGYIAKERFLTLLKPNEKNWVIIATSNQVIVSDAINSLISLPEETTARVFTFDKGKVYNKIDNTKLAKLEFTFVSDEYTDENSFESKSFNSQYYKKNKALPSYYATKGFDITYDILIRLASGKELKETLIEGVSRRVETKFDYRDNSSLPTNKGVFIIKYNKDLTLTKLK